MQFLSRNSKNKSNIILTLISLSYLVVAFYLFERLGLLENLDKVMFSTSDSKVYLKISDFITGKTSTIAPRQIALRPFVYPLYLSIYNYIGMHGYVIVQLLLNILSITLVFNAVRNLTNSQLSSILAAAFLISNLSFTFITLHALTETLSIFLIASTVYFIAIYFTKNLIRDLFVSLFCLSAATCVKGIYIPFLLTWTCFVIYKVSRTNKISRWIWLLMIAIMPIITQMIFSFSITGKPSISSSGRVNFNEGYFTVVYGFAKSDKFLTHRDRIAEDAKKNYPSLRSKAQFLIVNFHATLKASMYLLRHNLSAGSNFINRPDKAIKDKPFALTLFKLSEHINTLILWIHIMSLIVMVCCCLFRLTKELIPFYLLLSFLIYSIIFLSILTYLAGDRIIIAGISGWAVLYPILWSKIMHLFKRHT